MNQKILVAPLKCQGPMKIYSEFSYTYLVMFCLPSLCAGTQYWQKFECL